MMKRKTSVPSLFLVTALIFIGSSQWSQLLAIDWVVTNVNDSGAGSLRSAINFANGSAGGSNIIFAIPGSGPHTITLITPLPILLQSLTVIDGSTQPGIELVPAGVMASGIRIQAESCTIKGLRISGFDIGITIFGDICSTLIEDCTIDHNLKKGIDSGSATNTQFRRNTMYCNGTAPGGDPVQPSPNAKQPPVITSATANAISGTATYKAPVPGFPDNVVEVFIAGDTSCLTAGVQGKTYLDQAIVNPDGTWSVSGNFPTGVALTATVTNPTACPIPCLLYADFGFNILTGTTVQFTDMTIGGTPTSWEWDFGDGTMYSGQVPPVHVYDDYISYHVTLTVSLIDANGEVCTSMIEKDIDLNCPLSAAYSQYQDADYYDLIYFYDQSSGNPDTWAWDFDDPDSGPDNYSDEAEPYHIFTYPGTYNVCLDVSVLINGVSCEDYICQDVVIEDPCETLVADFIATPIGGHCVVAFEDNSLGGPTAWFWDFGVPGISSDTSILQNPSYAFPGFSASYVCLTVYTDAPYCEKTTCQWVNPYCDLYITDNDSIATPSGSKASSAYLPPANAVTSDFSPVFCIGVADTTSVSICENETYPFYGNLLTSSGTYDTVFVASNGCDSTIVLILTVNPLPVVDLSGDLYICSGQTTLLTASGGVSYLWNTMESTVSITVGTAGIYSFVATDINGCTNSISATITVIDTPTADAPADVVACDSYTLPALGTGNYFTGSGGTGLPLSAGDAIASTQTIYVYAETGTTPNCTDENSFTVTINATPSADAPADVAACDSYTLPALGTGNYFTGSGGTGSALSAGDAITGTQTIYVYAETSTTPNCTDENSFTVTINATPSADAPADVAACDSYTLPALGTGNYFTGSGGTGLPLSAGDAIASTQTIYVYAETGTTPNCTDENSFTVTINATPSADAPADVAACDSYTLPALGTGNYFTGSGGTGSALSAGDAITGTQTIYVYAETSTTPNCTDENSFTVTINATPSADAPADVAACDSYTLPALGVGNYFTGPGGTGSALSAGDAITSTQTIYVFAETGTTPNCTDENSFTVTILPAPTADAPVDVTACDSYTLPALGVGNYFTGPGGTGSALSAGDAITSTQTIYVFAETGTTPNCTDENSFAVTILPAPTADTPVDVTACDSYSLPALGVGNYFTGPGGTGSALSAGDAVTTTQIIYVYAETGTTPNCTDENSFTVTILPAPTADAPVDVIACDSYTLPALGVGNYFTGPGGTGSALSAGDAITSTQTIYVFAETGTTPNCTDENSFTVTILPAPTADAPADVAACDSYTLLSLGTGNYFTGAGGTGSALSAGDAIAGTQTIYVYAETGTTPNCTDENSFTVTINTTPTTNVLTDEAACDSYTLLSLGTGNYFTAPGGTGISLSAGDAITSTQTVYVYAESGTIPNCASETSFDVTINATPAADALADEAACDSYTLLSLGTGNYFTAPGGTGILLSAGDPITSSQTIYVYAESGTTPNCSTETSFDVTINSTPTADALADETACDHYDLLPLGTGNYFTAPGGTGTALIAGDAITTTQTVYVYAESGTTPNCSTESSFDVTINVTPSLSAQTDVVDCNGYTLLPLGAGNYFTAPGGTGTMLNAGDLISSTQTIYAYAESGTTPNCVIEESFTVTTAPVVDAPADVEFCGSYTLPALVSGNYFTGPGGTGAALNAGDLINSTQTVYVFAETGTTPNCIDENSFVVTINATPTVDAVSDVAVCDNYTLLALGTGNYFTGSGGTGTALSAGDAITSSQTVYVYAETATTPNCTDESSFTITVNTTPTVDILTDEAVCDSYTLLPLGSGAYFTGPGGTGSILNTGDAILSTQTVYVYAETGTTPNCADESSFDVTVNNTVVADAPADVAACDSYILPILSAGSYFTESGGTGLPLNPGDTITISQMLFVYTESATTPNCTDENSFTITVSPSPVVSAPLDVTACDSYTLPDLNAGKYFTGPGGTGSQLNTGDVITSTQTLYVFAASAANPACTDENSFLVTIIPAPIVDEPANVISCGDYTLPALGVGNYFTGTGGTGAALSAGDVISSTQTLYVYAETGTIPNCTDEHSFTVTTALMVDAPADVAVCDQYILPDLALGNYFTATGGGGDALLAGDTISSTQTLYVYAQTATTPNCTDEETFTVTVTGSPTAVILGDTDICKGDATTFTATGGTDYVWNTASTSDAISADTAGVYSVTVTDANGCTDVTAVNLTVNPLPVVSIAGDLTLCPGESTTLFASGGISYSWSTADTSMSITVSAAGDYTVVATDANSCSATETATVSVVNCGDLVADFIVSQDIACVKHLVYFTDQSSPNTTNWFWDFGNGNYSNSQNPFDIYPDTGTYTVTLIATDSITSFSDTSYHQIYVYPHVVADFTWAIPDSCKSNTVAYTDISQSIYPIESWKWNFGDGNYDTEQNPDNTYAEYDIENVGLVIIDIYGCVDSINLDVPVLNLASPGDEANAGEDLLLCQQPSVVNLASTPSSLPNVTGYWSQSQAQAQAGVVIVDPANPNTEVSGLQSDNIYTFTWTLSASPCGDYTSDEVVVDLTAGFLEQADAGADQHTCPQETNVLLLANAPAGTTGMWTTLGTAVIDLPVDAETAANNLSTGENIFVWTLSSDDCPDYSSDTMVVSAYGDLVVLNDTFFNLGNPPNVRLYILANDILPNSPEINVDLITTPLGGSLSANPDGSYTFTAPSELTENARFIYQVCVEDCPAMCATAEVTLLARLPSSPVPPLLPPANVITPNDDGTGDAAIIPNLPDYPNGVEFIVLSRWGDVVFQTKNYDNNWKGTNNNGKALPDGTYYYIIRAGVQDEQVLQGTITILR
jgi:gliding motility-associated-like protein